MVEVLRRQCFEEDERLTPIDLVRSWRLIALTPSADVVAVRAIADSAEMLIDLCFNCHRCKTHSYQCRRAGCAPHSTAQHISDLAGGSTV